MNLARGRNFFSLLQKGYGARAGSVSTSDFLGGFYLSKQKEERCPVAATTHADFGRRLLNTSARRGGGRKPVKTHPRRVPSIAIAKKMPIGCKEMNNSDLVMLGAMGNADARKEILIRHVMVVDNVTWGTAHGTFEEIADKNREGMWTLTLPYKFGIGLAVTAAFASFPLVFDFNTVSWFNEFYVTADVPEPKDLETPLEVGSWAWNWMEPPLGQMSFFLLCMQFTRAQIANIGIRPYTEKMMVMRAAKLAKAYPKYDAKVIMDFSEAISLYDDKHGLRADDK